MHRVTKEKEQEKAAFEPVYQEYLESEDHAKLMETLNKAEDEDEYKNDTDPQGFFAYKKLVSFGCIDFIWLAFLSVFLVET